MIDLHSHILPGLDDGAQTLADSLDIARAAVADGIRIIAATPHVRDDFPTPAAAMEAGVDRLRGELSRERLPLELVTGGEIALDRLPRLTHDELERFCLGRSRYLLVETPYSGWPLNLAQLLFDLHVRGLTPVLAHPERNRELQGNPDLLEPIVAAGTLVQITAASAEGRLGAAPRRTATLLLESRCAHLLASDAHAPSLRAVGMSRAAASIRDAGLARWLTEDVPAAILAGDAIPERPASQTAPRGRWRRFWPE